MNCCDQSFPSTRESNGKKTLTQNPSLTNYSAETKFLVWRSSNSCVWNRMRLSKNQCRSLSGKYEIFSRLFKPDHIYPSHLIHIYWKERPFADDYFFCSWRFSSKEIKEHISFVVRLFTRLQGYVRWEDLRALSFRSETWLGLPDSDTTKFRNGQRSVRYR